MQINRRITVTRSHTPQHTTHSYRHICQTLSICETNYYILHLTVIESEQSLFVVVVFRTLFFQCRSATKHQHNFGAQTNKSKWNGVDVSCRIYCKWNESVPLVAIHLLFVIRMNIYYNTYHNTIYTRHTEIKS